MYNMYIIYPISLLVWIFENYKLTVDSTKFFIKYIAISILETIKNIFG